ncbi:Xyloglucan endo-transglycosylase, C-terminal [Sesbania bispinosa]|nr:Xyloglucan endo-transglycosylase, C-terminal [Sesbania bispinosa]
MNSCVTFILVFSLLAYGGDCDCEYIPFEQNYAPLWGPENVRVLDQSSEVQLTLDQHSGCGFQSLQKYGSGWFSMRIKMPDKDSTAVITTFYLNSDNNNVPRDEIDFELLGGNKERPYILHTNIYINGQGGREQQIYLWFDPTVDFHNYTLLWNQKQLVFMVDNIPIRVFKNTTEKGGSYPTQAMRIMATIWSSTWASNGAPVNWTNAPFEAHYRGFAINACQTQNTSDQQCHSSEFWWNTDKYWSLNSLQKQAYNNVRSKYLHYDYCTKNFQSPECQD